MIVLDRFVTMIVALWLLLSSFAAIDRAIELPSKSAHYRARKVFPLCGCLNEAGHMDLTYNQPGHSLSGRIGGIGFHFNDFQEYGVGL